MMTFLIFKPSRPHLPLSSRCMSSGSSTVMRAIGPLLAAAWLSVTHFSGSTGGFGAFVAVASPVFFGMGHHLQGFMGKGGYLFGGGSVGVNFENGLPQGGAFGKGDALRYERMQHGKGVVGQGREHVPAYGCICDFAVNHKSSFDVFLECGCLGQKVNDRLGAPYVMRRGLYRNQDKVCSENNGTGDGVDLRGLVDNHVVVVGGVGRNLAVQLVGRQADNRKERRGFAMFQPGDGAVLR